MRSARLWLRGAKRAALESPPQEQIERLVAVLVEASGQIHRTQERIHSQKYAGVLLGVAESRVAALLPHVARLERQAQVGRHVQVPGATAADLPVVQDAGNAEIRPGERVCPEPGEIEEAPEREQQADVCEPGLQRHASGHRERQRIAPEGVGAEIVERHLVGGLLRAGRIAYPAPRQDRPLAAVREVDIVEPVVGEAHEVVARVEGREALLRQIRIRRVADLETEMPLLELRAGADLDRKSTRLNSS